MPDDKDIDLAGDWATLQPSPKPAPRPAARPGVLDVNELRATTERAIQEGKDKKLQAEMIHVEAILQKATERARKEAVKGKNSCRVMKLQWEKDYVFSTPGHARSPDNKDIFLKGIGKLVHDRLHEAQIKVEFERDPDSGWSGSQAFWLLIKW